MEVLNTSNVCRRGQQPIVVGAGVEIAMVARHLVNHDGAHCSIQDKDMGLLEMHSLQLCGPNWCSFRMCNIEIIHAEPGHRTLPLTGANHGVTMMQGLFSLPQQWRIYPTARNYGQIYQHCPACNVEHSRGPLPCFPASYPKGNKQNISLTTACSLLQLIRNRYIYISTVYLL